MIYAAAAAAVVRVRVSGVCCMLVDCLGKRTLLVNALNVWDEWLDEWSDGWLVGWEHKVKNLLLLLMAIIIIAALLKKRR